MKRLELDELNDYGKQLYWMYHSYYDICGTLMRSFEMADGKHDKQDKFLGVLVRAIRSEAEQIENTLNNLAKNPKKGYEVLK